MAEDGMVSKDPTLTVMYLLLPQKLNVPDGVSPTDSSKRGWFINPLGITDSLPTWTYFAAVLPGMLVFILIFMELQITGSVELTH